MNKETSVREIVGPWKDSDFESSLIRRCRVAWSKPIKELSNQELAIFLRQRIAVRELLQEAEERIEQGFEDGTEIDEEELQWAINHATSYPDESGQ